MKRLAIITTHPIQYNAPLFAMLSQRGKIEIKVFYTWGKSVLEKKYDPGFGKNIEWDIPLLEGYPYRFVKNIAARPGSDHFSGINNPFLVDEINEWVADAVLVYGWNFKSHLKALRYFNSKKQVLFRGDSTLVAHKGFFKNRLRAVFLKWVYSHVDKLFYVGKLNKDYYLRYGVKNSKLQWAPHAIDNKRFMHNSDALNATAMARRAELGISDTDLVFLYAGKLDENKNVQLLIKSFLQMNETNIHLLIAGNGCMEDQLKLLSEGKSNIHFLSFQNQQDMPVLYRMGNIFVLPSLTETWGLSINEAMASGRPVLVSDSCGAVIDLVQENINGFVFKTNDAVSILQKMQIIIKEKEVLTNYGLKAQQSIQDWNFETDCIVIEDTVLNHVVVNA